MPDGAVVVVKGPDHTLRSRALDDAVRRALGDDDRTLALAETTLPASRGAEGEEGGTEARVTALGAALDGARTPPFGTARRVVVVRTDEAYGAAEAEVLARYLSDPEPTTVLVLELPGRVPTELAKALKAAGVEQVTAGAARDATGTMLAEQLRAAEVLLDGEATRLVAERVGEEAGRVPAIVELLVSTFGPGASLGAADVEPYLGEEGGVPVFELTRAVDAGDVAGALATLQRLTGPMGMHPLQVMAILHNHLRRILRLDDESVRSEGDAVEALGGKVKPYPAKLAWQRAQRLGPDGIRRAYALLAKADLDLRGGSGAPDGAVVEVLVTRLATLSRRAGRGTGSGARSGPGPRR